MEINMHLLYFLGKQDTCVLCFTLNILQPQNHTVPRL